MTERIQLESVPNIPHIERGDNIGEIIITAVESSDIQIEENDILCVASKAVSTAEGQVVRLDDIDVTDIARQIHDKIPRKDIRTIQAIINATGAQDGSRLEVRDNYIGGWLANGLFLTSAGVDKHGPESIILLPDDPDLSARNIGKTIMTATGMRVGIIITDSDGRIDKRGATQVAIGTYGVSPIRTTESSEDSGKVKKNEETVSDMLAASAALIMGQRGTNKPVVLIRGYDYTFDESANIRDSLSKPS